MYIILYIIGIHTWVEKIEINGNDEYQTHYCNYFWVIKGGSTGIQWDLWLGSVTWCIGHCTFLYVRNIFKGKKKHVAFIVGEATIQGLRNRRTNKPSSFSSKKLSFSWKYKINMQNIK